MDKKLIEEMKQVGIEFNDYNPHEDEEYEEQLMTLDELIGDEYD